MPMEKASQDLSSVGLTFDLPSTCWCVLISSRHGKTLKKSVEGGRKDELVADYLPHGAAIGFLRRHRMIFSMQSKFLAPILFLGSCAESNDKLLSFCL